MSKSPISIEILETLDAIDRRESFAKAAEALNKAPSAISYAVQKLEEQLDVTIFERQGRRSVLTAAGRLLLEEGRVILQATHRLAEHTRQVATGLESQIRVAIESIYPAHYFFEALNRFLKVYSTVQIDVIESVLNGGWEALERDEVDLLVGAPGPVPQKKGFRALTLVPADLVAVVSSSHPDAKRLSRPEKSEEIIATLRKVITHDTSKFQVARSAGLADKGQVFYVQNGYQKLEAILAGIGIGHLPKHLAEPYLASGLLIAPEMSLKESNNCYLAWRVTNKGKGLNELVKQLSTGANRVNVS